MQDMQQNLIHSPARLKTNSCTNEKSHGGSCVYNISTYVANIHAYVQTLKHAQVYMYGLLCSTGVQTQLRGSCGSLQGLYVCVCPVFSVVRHVSRAISRVSPCHLAPATVCTLARAPGGPSPCNPAAHVGDIVCWQGVRQCACRAARHATCLDASWRARGGQRQPAGHRRLPVAGRLRCRAVFHRCPGSMRT